MSARKLTVREVVVVLHNLTGLFGGLHQNSEEWGDVQAARAILARWDDEVEAEQRAEHERQLDDAHQPLDGVPF